MRALPFTLLLAACAAPAAAPLPDSAGPVGTERCHAISATAYEAAPGGSVGAGAIGDVAVTAKGAGVACRTLDDGATACSVRGEAFLRAGGGAQARHFHVPATRLATVTRVRGEFHCTMIPAE